MSDIDLFGNEVLAKPKHQVKGYAAQPGTGPAGEFCRTCAHASHVRYHCRTYWKCGLVKPTHGPGTDIRLKSPACSLWQAKAP